MKSIFLSLACAALSLAACSATQVAAVNTDISTVASGVLAATTAACTDVMPIAAVASATASTNPTVANLLAYEGSVCDPTGSTVAGAAIDPTTAAWIGALKTGLQVAANIGAPSATTASNGTTAATPAASPTP